MLPEGVIIGTMKEKADILLTNREAKRLLISNSNNNIEEQSGLGSSASIMMNEDKN